MKRLVPLSQSRFEQMACAYLYWQKQIIGTEEPPSPYALRGTEVHAALAAYITHLKDNRLQSDYSFFDTLVEQGATTDAVEILQNLKEDLLLDPDRVLGVEMYLALDEDFEPHRHDIDCYDAEGKLTCEAVHYEGTLDYVQIEDDDTIEIWDHKTMFATFAADTYQSKHYPLLIFMHYPAVKTVRFHLKFVRFDATRSVEYTRDDIPALVAKAQTARRRQLALHRAAEEDQQFVTFAEDAFSIIPKGMEELREESTGLKATPGPHCMYCPLLLTGCPIKAINPYKNISAEDRIRFEIWSSAASAVNRRYLRDQIKASGPVQISDGNGNLYEAGMKKIERTTYPLLTTLPLVQEYDAQEMKPKFRIEDKLVIGASKLKEAAKAKRRASFREKLKTVAVRTIYAVLKISGIDPIEEELQGEEPDESE